LQYEPATKSEAKAFLQQWSFNPNLENNEELMNECFEVANINSNHTQIRETFKKIGRSTIYTNKGVDYEKYQEFHNKYEELGLLVPNNIDMGKYYDSFHDVQDYVGRQKFLEERQQKLLNKRFDFLTDKEKKMLFRIGVPDNKKRQVILDLFKINIHTCDYDYAAIKKAADADFH
jgi:hypothetical protein